MKKIAGEKYLSSLVDKTFYFSPYPKKAETKFEKYNLFYDDFNRKLSSLLWLKEFSNNENYLLDKEEWQKFKIEFGYRI